MSTTRRLRPRVARTGGPPLIKPGYEAKGKFVPPRRTVLNRRFITKMNTGIAYATGGVVKRMSWRPLPYARLIVGKGEKTLEGWPLKIPFGHPNLLPGGRATIARLIKAWDSGILRFEDASAEAIRIGRICSNADLPGTRLPEPAPACYGPFQMSTYGCSHPGTNKKKPKTGPKTPKLVDESKYQFD